MRKSNKAKQNPSRTCADCFHFCACHQWVTSISTDVAPQCPIFEPVRYRTLAELDDLRQMHKGDLAPVVHARWVHRCRYIATEIREWCCSACGELPPGPNQLAYELRYCPSCGSKMDAKEE